MAYTLTVATRIANYGADKMDAQGYRIDRMCNDHGFYVDRPATEKEEAANYIVGILGDFTSCTCPFHKENGICKHVVACQRFAADEARYDAMEALLEEAAWADFAAVREEVAAGAPAGFDWPTCEYHGAYEASENGFPISWCEGCERVAM